MEQIFERAEDVHVRNTLVYVKTGDAYAYLDEDKTVKIPADDLKNLFEKGMIIVDGTTLFSPVRFDLANGVGAVVYAKSNATTPSTAVLTFLQSSEYVAG